MNTLIKSTGDNTVGCSKIQYVSVKDILSFPALDAAVGYGVNVLDMTFTTESGLGEMLVLPMTKGSGKFSEVDKITDNGKLFTQQIVCTCTLDSGNKAFDNGPVINEMDLEKYIVVVTKYDGISYLCGSMDNPMNLNISKRAEGLGNGSNTYDFVFSIDAIKRAPVAVFY